MPPSPSIAVLTLLACVAFVGVSRLPALTASRSDRLASLDGLRGLLASLVFLHHFYITYHYRLAGQWVTPASSVYSVFGSGGVSLFFMITGYLFIGKIKAVRGHVDLDRFYIGRVFRIVPIYVLSTALVYLCVFLVTGFHLDPTLAGSLDQWIFFHGTAVNGYGFTPFINAGVVWTLDYEWIFYFSIPVIAVLWRKLGLRPWAILLASILALYFKRNEQTIPGLDMSSGMFAPFALGGLASELCRVASVRRALRGARGGVLSVAAAAVLFFAFDTAYSVSAYLVLFVFFVPVAAGNAVFGVLRLRAVVFLGEISYDIYMLHGIVLFVLFTILMPDAMQGAHTQGRLLSLMLVTAGIVILVSTAAHLVVERPMLRLGRKVAPIDEVQALAAP